MCGRFTIMLDPEDFQRELGLGDLPQDFKSNLNVAPGQLILVVVNSTSKNVELYRWGLVPVWAKDPIIGYKMINARAETIAEKPSFKQAFAHRRCLILADGFYEWKKEGNKKQPYLFQLQERKPFTFAGIWEHWQDRSGNEITSCAIITTTPNQILQEYHDRMPVILEESTRWRWLENAPISELQMMLKPYPDEEMIKPESVDPKSLYLVKG